MVSGKALGKLQFFCNARSISWPRAMSLNNVLYDEKKLRAIQSSYNKTTHLSYPNPAEMALIYR